MAGRREYRWSPRRRESWRRTWRATPTRWAAGLRRRSASRCSRGCSIPCVRRRWPRRRGAGPRSCLSWPSVCPPKVLGQEAPDSGCPARPRLASWGRIRADPGLPPWAQWDRSPGSQARRLSLRWAQTARPSATRRSRLRRRGWRSMTRIARWSCWTSCPPSAAGERTRVRWRRGCSFPSTCGSMARREPRPCWHTQPNGASMAASHMRQARRPWPGCAETSRRGRTSSARPSRSLSEGTRDRLGSPNLANCWSAPRPWRRSRRMQPKMPGGQSSRRRRSWRAQVATRSSPSCCLNRTAPRRKTEPTVEGFRLVGSTQHLTPCKATARIHLASLL